MLTISLLCLFVASVLVNIFQYWETCAVVAHNHRLQESNEQLRSALIVIRSGSREEIQAYASKHETITTPVYQD